MEGTFEEINIDVPTVLPLVDGSCDVGLDSLTDLSFWAWNGFEIEQNSLSESSWRSESVMHSPAISGTFYGYQEVNTVRDSCKNLTKVSQILSNDCIERIDVTSPPQQLRICSPREYPRQTIESAALSVAGAIDQTYRFVRSNFSEFKINPLALFVLPDIRFSNLKAEDLAITDNAGWVLSNKFPGISQYLVFYPMSQKYQDSGRAAFWEVPWIVSHEYGHHLFYSLLSPSVASYFGYALGHGVERPFHHSFAQTKGQAGFDEKQLFTGVNEAIADLVAHYTLGNDSFQMTSLSCSFAYRDVNSSQLNDGRQKQFLYDGFSEISSDPCEYVDLSDVHTVGAIVAYFIDQFLQSEGYQSAHRKSREVFRLLLALNEDLQGSIAASGGVSIMTSLVDQLVRLHGGESELSEQQCALIQEVFTDAFTYPFSMSFRYESCNG